MLDVTARIEAGADAFATFVSLASACVPALGAECVVEIVACNAVLHRAAITRGTDSRAAVVFDDNGEPLASTRNLMRSGAAHLLIDDIVAVPVVSSIALESSALEPYIGALTCVHAHRPVAEVATLMQALVGRTVDMVSSKRLSQALAIEQGRTHNLESALDSNREIGMAMGIVMARSGCTRDDAFDRLRRASQDGNRKLRDIAADVVLTGAFNAQPAASRTTHPDRREFTARQLRAVPTMSV